LLQQRKWLEGATEPRKSWLGSPSRHNPVPKISSIKIRIAWEMFCVSAAYGQSIDNMISLENAACITSGFFSRLS